MKIHQIQELSMDMHTLSLDYMSEILLKNRPILGRVSRLGDLTEYIQDTNGFLAKREINEEVAVRVACGLAIAVYSNSILNLDIGQDNSVSNFKKLLTKKPYSLEEPFHVGFEPINKHMNRPDSLDISVLGGVIPLSPELFSQRDKLQSELFSRKHYLSEFVPLNYTPIGHFTYVGLVNCCIPLFCGEGPSVKDINCLDSLSSKYGNFIQNFPIVLKDKLKIGN